jgi:hypothetical protein
MGFVAACHDFTLPTAKPTIVIRSLRADTIATLYLGDCKLAELSKEDQLNPRELILPQAIWSRTVDPGCYDMEVRNARDSVLDARSRLQVENGDSVIVVFR